MRALALAVATCASAFSSAQSGPMTLQGALDYAKAHSPVLKSAQAEFLGAVAFERGAKAMTGPQLSANGFTSTGNNTSILNSVPKTEPPVSMQVPSGQFSDANLMLMVPLLDDDVQAMAASARWQAQAAAGDYKEAESNLELSVRLAYSALRAAREDVAVAEVGHTALVELLKNTQARFEAGKTVEASVHRVQAQLKRAERDLTMAKNASAKATLDLLEVIGGSLDAQIEPTDADQLDQKEFVAADLVRMATENRGVLLAAMARAKASEAELKAANALGRPRLYATGMADATSRRDMGGVTLGLSLSFPIFDGGRVRSEVDRAKSMKQRAEADLATTRLQVEKEVRQALLDASSSRANLVSAQTALEAATSNYDVTAMRVEAGKAILLEQLDALAVLSQARSDVVKARLDLFTAAARLAQASGVKS